jgi:hypothetical protein
MKTEELIDVNKFAEMADIYVTDSTRAEEVTGLPDRSIIFAHDARTAAVNVFPHIADSSKKYVVITARDLPVDQRRFNSIPASVLKWFGNNVTHHSSLTHGIPIGLPPLNLVFNPDDGKTGPDKRAEICQLIETEKEIENLVYVNHLNRTNNGEREHLYSSFKKFPWTTCKGGDKRINYSEYIRDVHSHQYMLSPPGKGIDCHRVWESLYLGTTPIVKRSSAMSWFSELPIIFVDDFSQVNPEFLTNESVKLKDKTLDMLKMSYWESLIRQAQNNL